MTTAIPEAPPVPVVTPPAILLAGVIDLPEAAELVNQSQRWIREQVRIRKAATQVEQWHIPPPGPGLVWQRRWFYLWALSMGYLGPVPYLWGLRVIGYSGIIARTGVKANSVRAIPGRQRRPQQQEDDRARMPGPVAYVLGGRTRMPVFPLDDSPDQMGVEAWLAIDPPVPGSGNHWQQRRSPQT